MTDAVGPVFTGGFEEVATGDNNNRYAILFLPDKHNDELQLEGKPPVYYWMPNYVRIARKGDTGDYKFHLIHFVGVQTGDTTVGVAAGEQREVAGGVFSVTTTAAFPTAVMQNAQEQLLDRFRGKDLRYWGWRTSAAPMFRPMPIVANQTAITNLAPDMSGKVPAAPASGTGATPGQPAPAGGAPAAGGGAGAPAAGAPRSITGKPRSMKSLPRTVPHGPSFRAPSNLDLWYWKMQGDGPGTIDPSGENAYSGLVGSLPAAILWQGFHGAYSPIVVSQALKLKVWSQAIRLVIDGDWDKIFTHFSADFKSSGWWWDVDIKVQFNNMITNGTIKVQLEIDTTLPNADKLREEINKREDLIFQKFMDAAKQMIFDPKQPDVKPAEASSNTFFGFGGGAALNYRRDETKLTLHYEETIDEQYLQETFISSSLEGFYNEIKADPANEQKYFTTLYLDDWDRKVSRIVKPVVNWPDPTKKWVGEPVAFLSVQVGYPSDQGDIQWAPHVFQSTDTASSTTWTAQMAKKNAGDVHNAPQNWTPDKTYVKRMVHLTEPPSETDSPYMRVYVEKNVIDLDPGENGTLTTENTLEVRADNVGTLAVGPVSLNVVLEDKQTVEVEFQADGKTDDGNLRPVLKFSWNSQDQNELRYWEIFTGQPKFVPNFKYRVHVLVKGSIFTKGAEWYGPWVEAGGNGPLMLSVPTPDDPGVVKKDVIPAPLGTKIVHGGIGPPPANGKTTGKSVGVGAPKSPGIGQPPAIKSVSSNGGSAGSGYSYAPKSDGSVTTKSVPGNGKGNTSELDLLPDWSPMDPAAVKTNG